MRPTFLRAHRWTMDLKTRFFIHILNPIKKIIYNNQSIDR